MTLLVLCAIFCVLVVIARELRLLRERREAPSTPFEKRTSDGYKPRIFTFARSRWPSKCIEIGADIIFWAGAGAWYLIFHRFIEATLSGPWAKYPTLIFGGLIAGGLFRALFEPIERWTEKYDEQVYLRTFSKEEQEEIKSIANSTRCTSTNDIEEQSRILRREKEQIEQMYRAKGL
jgi:hypothetical protein